MRKKREKVYAFALVLLIAVAALYSSNKRSNDIGSAVVPAYDLRLAGGSIGRPVLKLVDRLKLRAYGDVNSGMSNFVVINGGVISGIKRPKDFYKSLDKGPAWMQANYEPGVGCAGEIRIGIEGNGGKWICPELIKKNECTVLSIGVGGRAYEDTSFERTLAREYGCEVRQTT